MALVQRLHPPPWQLLPLQHPAKAMDAAKPAVMAAAMAEAAAVAEMAPETEHVIATVKVAVTPTATPQAM